MLHLRPPTGQQVASNQQSLTLIQVRNGQRVVLMVGTRFQILWAFVLNLCVGHVIVDVCIIFCIVPSTYYSNETPLGRQITSRFLAYVRRYDVVNQQESEDSSRRGPFPEPTTGLYLLKKATRANGERIGDIVPLDQIRGLVDLAPRFGVKANSRLTSGTSIAYSTEFWLNKYFDKELFYALS